MYAAHDELVGRAVRGDHEALSDLLDLSTDRITGRLAGQIGAQWRSVLDVDDVLQVTFLEAFLQVRNLNGSDVKSFQAWLARIAENNLRDAIRGLQCEKRPQPARRVQPPAGHDSFVGLFELVGGTSTSVGGKVARGEIRQILESTLDKLPEDYAKVIRLYDLDGLTAPQVGERIGKSRGAVHMLRSRGLARLVELLGSESKFFSNCP